MIMSSISDLRSAVLDTEERMILGSKLIVEARRLITQIVEHQTISPEDFH